LAGRCTQQKELEMAEKHLKLPDATGNWTTDNGIGRDHAKVVIAVIEQYKNPALLPAIVNRELLSQKPPRDFDGVVCGFFQQIAETGFVTSGQTRS
jgi:hypothetical protein